MIEIKNLFVDLGEFVLRDIIHLVLPGINNLNVNTSSQETLAISSGVPSVALLRVP